MIEKKGSTPVNENEIAELVNVNRLKEDLQKAIDQLKSDYVKNVTLRSAAGKNCIIQNIFLFF